LAQFPLFAAVIVAAKDAVANSDSKTVKELRKTVKELRNANFKKFDKQTEQKVKIYIG